MYAEGKKIFNNRNRSESPKKIIKHTKTEYKKNIQLKDINDNNIISNAPLYSLKETFICVFCGGKNCKHEDYRNHKNPAILGLNSDKIDDNIYASQRPANSLIKEFNLISKFKELNIGLIVNLQLPGEHPYCGPIDKLDESGFAYSPSLFESEGIHVGLYGWKDMNVPNSLNHMLEIVKSMYYYVHYLKKKVLVHCHAGYGRTGIVIACFKIFDESITAEVAKTEIRKIRPKCIQNKDQLLYCINFQEFIRRLKANFNLKEKRTIENFIKYQNDLNVGKYKFINFDYNKSVPLFLIYIFDSIIDNKNKNNIDDCSLYKCLNGSITIHENANELIDTLAKNINDYNWDILYSCEDPIILCELLYKWLQKSIEYVIDPKNIFEIENNFSDYEQKLKTCEYQTILLINKFLSLINNTSNDEETKTEKNNFIRKLIHSLLGYPLETNILKREELGNVDKLIKLISFIDEKQKKENLELKGREDDKELILSNIYEQLKQHFENKNNYKDDKQINIGNKLDTENLFKSLNNLINNKNLKTNEEIFSNKNQTKKEVTFDTNNFNKSMGASRLGVVQALNVNYNNTIRLSKSFKSNITIKDCKNALLTSYKVIEEVEEEKDIPWIREEDC